MEPPPAASDLGSESWERELIKAVRERHFLWRTEQTYREWAVRFRDELEDTMSPDYAHETLQAAITWGRYAELFSYDEEADQFFLHEAE